MTYNELADIPRSTASHANEVNAEILDIYRNVKLPADWVSAGVRETPFGLVELGQSASVTLVQKPDISTPIQRDTETAAGAALADPGFDRVGK